MKKSTLILILPFFLIACDHDEDRHMMNDKMEHSDSMKKKMTKEEMEDKKERMEEVETKETPKIKDTMIDDIKKMEKEKMEETVSTEDQEESIMDKQKTTKEESMEMMVQAEKYQDYDQELFEALEGKQNMILFFYAAWCPSCRAWDKMINDNLDSLPESTVILKIDYDTATDLKKKYEVTSQSTAVFVSTDGTTKKQADPSVSAVSSFFGQ